MTNSLKKYDLKMIGPDGSYWFRPPGGYVNPEYEGCAAPKALPDEKLLNLKIHVLSKGNIWYERVKARENLARFLPPPARKGLPEYIECLRLKEGYHWINIKTGINHDEVLPSGIVEATGAYLSQSIMLFSEKQPGFDDKRWRARSKVSTEKLSKCIPKMIDSMIHNYKGYLDYSRSLAKS